MQLVGIQIYNFNIARIKNNRKKWNYVYIAFFSNDEQYYYIYETQFFSLQCPLLATSKNTFFYMFLKANNNCISIMGWRVGVCGLGVYVFCRIGYACL